jgi:hypothetical protein
MEQLQMFAQNIRLLIGILVALALGLILLIASWTGIKIWLFRKRQALAEEEERRQKIGRDGRPLPPRAAGICQQCQKAGEVFHLPDGRRFCERCYGSMSIPN